MRSRIERSQLGTVVGCLWILLVATGLESSAEEPAAPDPADRAALPAAERLLGLSFTESERDSMIALLVARREEFARALRLCFELAHSR